MTTAALAFSLPQASVDEPPPTLRVSSPPPLRAAVAPGERRGTGLKDIIELGRRVLEAARQVAPFLPPEPACKGFTPEQPISFRRLAKIGVLSMGASSMWRAASIYRLAQAHPELYGYRHLGVAHLAPLLRLESPLRLAVLRRAERRQWSRRRLETKLRALQNQQAAGIDPLVDYLDELLPAERPELPTQRSVPHNLILGLRSGILPEHAEPASHESHSELQHPGAPGQSRADRCGGVAGPVRGRVGGFAHHRSPLRVAGEAPLGGDHHPAQA